jgi:nuclear receptor interaction protein
MYMSDVNTPPLLNNLNRYQCHGDKTAYEIRTIEAEPAVFVTCGQDGTCKWIDTRAHAHCHKPYCNDHTLLKLPTGITAIAVHPLVPFHLVCAGLDGLLRFFDRRMLTMGATSEEVCNVADNQTLLSSLKNHSIHGLFASFSPSGEVTSTTPTNTLNSKRITSVQYDTYAEHVLAGYQPDIIYLLDWRVRSSEN